MINFVLDGLIDNLLANSYSTILLCIMSANVFKLCIMSANVFKHEFEQRAFVSSKDVTTIFNIINKSGPSIEP